MLGAELTRRLHHFLGRDFFVTVLVRPFEHRLQVIGSPLRHFVHRYQAIMIGIQTFKKHRRAALRPRARLVCKRDIRRHARSHNRGNAKNYHSHVK